MTSHFDYEKHNDPSVPLIIGTYLGVRIGIQIAITHPAVIAYGALLGFIGRYLYAVYEARSIFEAKRQERQHAEIRFHRNMALYGCEPWKSGAQHWLEVNE